MQASNILIALTGIVLDCGGDCGLQADRGRRVLGASSPIGIDLDFGDDYGL